MPLYLCFDARFRVRTKGSELGRWSFSHFGSCSHRLLGLPERYVAHNPGSVFRASATAGRSQIGGSLHSVNFPGDEASQVPQMSRRWHSLLTNI